MALNKVRIDYRNVKSIDIVFIQDSTKQTPTTLTDEDTIKDIINSINKSHKSSILKARWNYKLNILFKDNTISVIGISGRYLKKEGGWYRMRHDLENYIIK